MQAQVDKPDHALLLGKHHEHVHLSNVLFSAGPVPQPPLVSTHMQRRGAKPLQYTYCGQNPQEHHHTIARLVLIAGVAALLPTHMSC